MYWWIKMADEIEIVNKNAPESIFYIDGLTKAQIKAFKIRYIELDKKWGPLPKFLLFSSKIKRLK